MEEAEFVEKQLRLAKGELLLLYTDGVTEARDKRGREFGEQGIVQVLRDKQDLTSHQAIQALKGSICAFVGRTPQHDDITIMALKTI